MTLVDHFESTNHGENVPSGLVGNAPQLPLGDLYSDLERNPRRHCLSTHSPAVRVDSSIRGFIHAHSASDARSAARTFRMVPSLAFLGRPLDRRLDGISAGMAEDPTPDGV